MSVKPEDLGRTMMARHAARLAAWESRAEGLRSALARELASARQAWPFTRAWLIGTLAWGGFGERSDVDLVISGLAERDFTPLWNRLSERLEVSVDLMRLEVLPDGFQRRVLDEGVVIDVA